MNEQKFNANEIVDNFMWLGSITAASNPHFLTNHNITHVLNVKDLSLVAEIPKTSHPLEYKQVPMSDWGEPNLKAKKLPECLEFIDQAEKQNKRILVKKKVHLKNQWLLSNQSIEIKKVHCQMGVNRSATIVIAYLIKKNRWTFKQSFLYVKAKRPSIFPNEKYVTQLIEFEKEILNLEEPSISMKEYWEIALK